MSNYLDALIGKIDDRDLQTALNNEIGRLRENKSLGLVFEKHIPETVRLYSHPVKRGVKVQERAGTDVTTWSVVMVSRDTAHLTRRAGHETLSAERPVGDLVVVKEFGEPIFPGLKSLGRIERGGTKPCHTIISAENYHALQLLLYLYEGQADCIYIDPPYNTGARDWTYNNNFVDKNDSYRHSKWLSSLEKRLRLARRLLKPDGVLVVTIDENEVHHLGMLLEELFPDAHRQMVSICINPSGASEGGGLSRVEEYAIFCFLGGAQPAAADDDMLLDQDADGAKTEGRGVRWEWLMRGGNAWYRASRENLCYPVLLSKDRSRIVRAGLPLEGPEENRPEVIDGYPVAWPVRKDGRLGIWRVEGPSLNWLAERGYAFVAPKRNGNSTLRYLLEGTIHGIDAGRITITGRGDRGEVLVRASDNPRKTAKTIWYRSRHTAGGGGGTYLLNALLGERNLFPYPKSVYATRDCLQVAIGDRPNALIIDFFAGSGTTFNSVCLMNANGGNRRCILVTNNEVDEATARRFESEAVRRGDSRFEAQGIFARVTRPRCEAAVTGLRADGEVTEGQYLDGRAYSDGFEENVEFFELTYLDPDTVTLGRAFEAVAPMLWLRAGGAGTRIDREAHPWSLPPHARYGILFDPQHCRGFFGALQARGDVRHVFVVTDSLAVFQQLQTELPTSVTATMLYEDYLTNFEINTEAMR